MPNVRWKLSFFITDRRTLLTLCIIFMIYVIREWNLKSKSNNDSDIDSTVRFNFKITRTWDDKPIDHEPVSISLLSHTEAGLKVLVNAPFFNDPKAPSGTPGQPFSHLWDYEVVEVFFSNAENHYLEVELCPHGQHLVILLKGYRKPVKDMLPLEFKVIKNGSAWHGEAIIPEAYFPKDVTKMNAYAIHGSDEKRTYEALYPAQNGKHKEPDL